MIMNSELTTPTYAKLWHGEFWALVLADFFLTAAIYALIPFMMQSLPTGIPRMSAAAFSFLA